MKNTLQQILLKVFFSIIRNPLNNFLPSPCKYEIQKLLGCFIVKNLLIFVQIFNASKTNTTFFRHGVQIAWGVGNESIKSFGNLREKPNAKKVVVMFKHDDQYKVYFCIFE